MSAPSRGVMLVGLGPYAWNRHLPVLQKLGMEPALVIELASKRERTERWLDHFGFHQCGLILIPDELRTAGALDPVIARELDERIALHSVSMAVLSCEPSARLAWLHFCIERGLDIFSEKPPHVRADATTSTAAHAAMIEDEIRLCDAWQRRPRVEQRFCLNLNRRTSPAMRWLTGRLESLRREHGIPVTDIDIFYSGGTHHFAEEIHQRENHPFRHGYGMLFHSGYHYLDMIAQVAAAGGWNLERDFSELESTCLARRALESWEFQSGRAIAGWAFGHSDDLQKQQPLTSAGEYDLSASLHFRNEDEVALAAHLRLLTCGLTRRRSAHLPEDTYHGAGRMKHETLTVHCGPFACFRLFLLRADVTESEDKSPALAEAHEYRNTAAIGGRAFTRHTFDFPGAEIPRLPPPLAGFLKGARWVPDFADASAATRLTLHLAGMLAGGTAASRVPWNFSV